MPLKPIKIRPSTLGCDRPYSLTYSAGIKTEHPEDMDALRVYLTHYNAACHELLEMLKEHMVQPRYQLLFSLMLLPTKTMDGVQASEVWQIVQGEKPVAFKGHQSDKKDKAEPWAAINKNCGYPLLMVLLAPKDPESATTRPSRVWHQIINDYSLAIPEFDPKRVGAIFSKVPAAGDKNAITNDVFKVLRGYFSARANAQTENQRRQDIRRKHLGANPAFFVKFDAYCQDQRSWMRGCAHYRELRNTLKTQFKDQLSKNDLSLVLSACQRTAMMDGKAAHILSWQRLLPLTQEQKTIAEQNPKVVQAFIQAIPTEHNVTQEEDVFRRFSSKNTRMPELARNPYHMRQLLTYYNEAKNIFLTDEAKKEYVETVQGFPPQHAGWKKICAVVIASKKTSKNKGKTQGQIRKATQEEMDLYDFVERDVREFMQSSREVSDPKWPEHPDFWPQLAEGKRWEIVEILPGNRLKVLLTIPPFSPEADAKSQLCIPVYIRGYLPFPQSKEIDEPLNVHNGLPQFWPNRKVTFKVDREKTEKLTYLKLQALRLLIKGPKNHIKAHISATQITQVTHNPTITKDYAKNIQPGERVGVVHFLPGGSMLCALTLFEKSGPGLGWQHVPMSEIIHDNRTVIREEREGVTIARNNVSTDPGGSKRFISNQRAIRRAFIEIDDYPYAEFVLGIEEQKKLLTAGKTTQESADVLAKLGAIKTHFGDTHYKRIAARLAKVCSRNKVAYLLVAGGGRLAVNPSIPHPVCKFFTLATGAGIKSVCGYLVNAMDKIGIPVLATRSKAAPVWIKPLVKDNDIAQCQFVDFPLPPGDPETWPEDWRNRKFIAPGMNPWAVVDLTSARIANEPSGKNSGNENLATKVVRVEPKGAAPYALNAAWAILLDHQHPAFRAHVNELITAREAKD